MLTETVHYQCNNVDFRGYLAYSKEARAKRPGVIIAHAWRGQDEFARNKAHALAELGYLGFAADLYGNGTVAANNEEALQLMLPLFLDRALLRERMCAAYEVIRNHPHINEEAIGVIGFCFGGLAAIELLRSGAAIRGAVSFHGLLGDKLNEHRAATVPNAKQIKGALLMLHGYKDPLVSHADIQNVQEEFTRLGVDWQMHTYGQAMHAFSNPQANDEKNGMLFNPQAALRSWQAMCIFFEDIFPS